VLINGRGTPTSIMASMRLTALFLLFTAFSIVRADVSRCACDPKVPESMKARECSLCNEAEKRPAGEEFFILKDINPRKPGRWLVLPVAHGTAQHHFRDLPKPQRDKLWREAIRVAKEKFGDEWGLAYNGERARTQCHLHLHVGRFIKAAEVSGGITVKRIEDIPAPEEGGIWVHPVAGGYHVHLGDQITETTLVR